MLPAGVESEVSVYEVEVAKYHLVEEESSERANDAQVQWRRRLHQQDSKLPPPSEELHGGCAGEGPGVVTWSPGSS